MRFTLIDNNGRRPYLDSLQYEPTCVVAVVRFREKTSYDFEQSRSKKTFSSQVEYPRVLELENIMSAHVVSSKESHVGNADVMLKDPTGRILRSVAPGDWLFIWMMDNQPDAKRLRERLHKHKPTNYAMDGLKFVGRIQGIRRRSNIVDQDAGTWLAVLNINASSFSELDSDIFYDPLITLSTEQNNSGLWIYDLLSNTNDEFLMSQAKEFSASKLGLLEDAVGHLIDVLLGRGPGGKEPSPLLERTPNQAYLVPNTVGELLGTTTPSKPNMDLNYADTLQIIMGIQEYSGDSNPSQEIGRTALVGDLFHDEDFIKMLPSLDVDKSGELKNRWFTNIRLQGAYNPLTVPWTGVPVWQIISGYLNPVVNEMYTTLKVGYNGKILPHLIVRQIPLTSNEYAASHTQFPVTTYNSLPRWVGDPRMIVSEDIGRSDSLRTNFAMALPTYPIPNPEFSIQEARKQVAPAIDISDIQRHGLRRSWSTVTAIPDDVVGANLGASNPNSKWSALVGDRLMGGHLRLNGTIIMQGVQAPIATGDNFEYNGILYHIEQISHTYQLEQTGDVSFVTTVQLTNGLIADAAIDKAWPFMNNLEEADQDLEDPVVGPDEITRANTTRKRSPV